MRITDEMLYQYAAEARDLWIRTLPSGADIPEHNFSKRFQRKMKRLIREQRRPPQVTRALRGLRRAAAIILIAGVISFSSSMTVAAHREKMIETIVRVFHDLTDYRFVSHGASTETPVDLPEITFQYIPSGMELVEDTSTERYRYILYEAQDGRFFELTQTLLLETGEYQKILDTEDAVTEHFYIGGSEAVCNTKNGSTTVFWTKDNVLYTIFGTIDSAELKQVAEKIAP